MAPTDLATNSMDDTVCRGRDATAASPWVVVPTYCPESVVHANIASMARQAPTVIVDDGSPASYRPFLEWLGELSNVFLLRHERNQGIAAALNAGIQFALDRGATVVVTFDQDSSPEENHVQRVTHVLEGARHSIGLVGPGFNGGLPAQRGLTATAGIVPVQALIQSGMAIPASTIHRVGTLDESLFIDGVDTEYCLRVRSWGLQVMALSDLQMGHRLGSGVEHYREIRIGRYRIVATFHSADRRYYINRNLIRVLRRHGMREREWAMVAIRRTMISNLGALLLESDRRSKGYAMIAGVFDGIRNTSGKRRARATGFVKTKGRWGRLCPRLGEQRGAQ